MCSACKINRIGPKQAFLHFCELNDGLMNVRHQYGTLLSTPFTSQAGCPLALRIWESGKRDNACEYKTNLP